jgi:cell division septal protein FtsQ
MRLTENRSRIKGHLDRGYRQPSIYTRTQQDPVRRDYKKSFLLTLLFILIIGIVYLAFFSPLFQVKSVEINNLKYQNKEKIEKKVSKYRNSFFLHNNLLSLSRSNLKKEINQISGIRDVNIIKRYPDRLVIQVEERTPAFVWQVLDHKYLVDETGLIWADYDDRFPDLLVVFDDKNLPTEIGKKPAPANFSLFVIGLNKDFSSMTGRKIKKMEVVDTTSELKVQSDSTWYAYFDTNRSVKNELINLSRVLEETKKKRLEYIDLRVENKIFYKNY